MNRRNVFFMLGGIAFLLVLAQDAALAAPLIPSVNVDVGSSNKPQDVAVTLQVMALLTILSLAPGILIMTTSFVRIVVVIGFLRNALSTQNVPPNQVVIALSLFLTFYIMSPYWSQANENGIQPYMAGHDVSTFTLMPAFVISELKTAFQIGFMIYVPFIVIDMIVASTLMSMGMMMLPPVMISLPFKILLFVMVDGWHLLIKSLIVSFK